MFRLSFIFISFLVISRMSAQLAGEACVKESEKIPIENESKKFLQCTDGRYLVRYCGFLHEFNNEYNECKLKLILDASNLECENLAGNHCAPGDSGPVINQCKYFCMCNQQVFTTPTRCSFDRYYDTKNQNCVVNSAVCTLTPKYPDSTCDTPGKKQPILTNCRYFMLCGTDNQWKKISCGKYRYYNPDSECCTYNYQWNWSIPFVTHPCDTPLDPTLN